MCMQREIEQERKKQNTHTTHTDTQKTHVFTNLVGEKDTVATVLIKATPGYAMHKHSASTTCSSRTSTLCPGAPSSGSW